MLKKMYVCTEEKKGGNPMSNRLSISFYLSPSSSRFLFVFSANLHYLCYCSISHPFSCMCVALYIIIVPYACECFCQQHKHNSEKLTIRATDAPCRPSFNVATRLVNNLLCESAGNRKWNWMLTSQLDSSLKKLHFCVGKLKVPAH